MKRIVIQFNLICLIFVSFSSEAADHYVVSKQDPCVYENGMDVSGTLEMIDCAIKGKLQQEKQLKVVWNCVLSHYPEKNSDGYKALLVEQAAWEEFLEKSCHFYTYDFGREGHISFQGCKENHIKQRTDYLNQALYQTLSQTDDTCLGQKK